MESVNIAHISSYCFLHLNQGRKKSTNKPNVQAISIALVRGNVSHTKINASRRQNKRPLSELILYRFNSLPCILSSFIFTITSKFLALRVSGLDFLKVKSQAGVLKKTFKSRSQTLKPGNRSLPNSQSYHSMHLLFPLPHLIHIALIVYNIIY